MKYLQGKRLRTHHFDRCVRYKKVECFRIRRYRTPRQAYGRDPKALGAEKSSLEDIESPSQHFRSHCWSCAQTPSEKCLTKLSCRDIVAQLSESFRVSLM